MTQDDQRIRLAVQKLTEAIWNLDQLEPLDHDLKLLYDTIQMVRKSLMKRITKEA